ncbi:MAG: DUF3108 domain-containing protein [Gemmatimonadaceae bacterium]
MEATQDASLLESMLDMLRAPRGISSIAVFSAVLSVPVGGVVHQQAPGLPFAPGERITYRVTAKGMGTIGHATMSVDGPVDVRGTQTLVLRSKTEGGFGPFRGSQTSASWFDPVARRSLRFYERERHFLSTHITKVEIYPDKGTWVADDGTSGETLTNESLDELSFIYFLRTLPVTPHADYQFNRHFDATRNPVRIRVTQGDTITTDLGRFSTTLMEMHVRDPHRYKGEGVIKVYLSNDKCRVPVRIDSDVPVVGAFVLNIESYTGGVTGCDPQLDAHPPSR